MNKILKTITNSVLVTLLSLGSLVTPVMAENNVVDTNPVESVVIETPMTEVEPSVTPSDKNQTPSLEGPSIVEEETNKVPSTGNSETTLPNVDDGLKDDLYSGSVLKDSKFDLNNLFERLIVKLRGLVENVRRVAVPILVLSWMALFFVAVARIVTGERGASARLVSGLFWVTFAYIGIVSAEAILAACVSFIMG